MTVAVAVSHAMFSARFDRGAMSAADRFIGYGRFHLAMAGFTKAIVSERS
jgi:hypothetical protein